MKYDVVVVGGGSAGCAVAARLSENPEVSVLLLEAGTDYPDIDQMPDEIKFGLTRDAEAQDSKHNWALRGTITEEQGEIHVAQGKVMGGGGSINGQVFLRGLPEDFDNWASWGNNEWSYVKVLPYYRKMETDLDIQDDYHGTDGPLPIRRRLSGPWAPIQKAFREACLEAGFGTTEDMNGPNPSGVGASPVNNMDDVRMSTAITYLGPARHRLNLTIRGDVFVRRVLFEDMAVAGVEAESGGEVFNVEAERVVLSAGALKSPHLLMLSGVGPKDQLESNGVPVLVDSPGVGQNLWNHPNLPVTYKVKSDIPLSPDSTGVRFALRYTADGSSDVNDMMLTTSSVFSPYTGEVLPDEVARIAIALELPYGSGFLRLASPDPAVQPSFDYRYFQHSDDIRRTREGVRLCLKLLECSAYEGISEGCIDPTDADLTNDDALDLWIRQKVSTARHVSGTCKLGPDSDPMAVVDQQCRVKGVKNLWVADSSVMPQVPRANANATAIMIGERVADWVS